MSELYSKTLHFFNILINSRIVLFVGTSAALQRDVAQRKILAPVVLVGNAAADEHSLENLQQKLNFEVCLCKAPQPGTAINFTSSFQG